MPAQGSWTDPHNHYTFAGKEWDEALGLYEFGVRLYDPWAGVWLTREPLPAQAWEPRTWHRYQYACASPISYYDLYGLAALPYGAWADLCLGQPEDPLCRSGALPPPGVLPQMHARLCATRAIALALSQQAQAGTITDLEALARLFEATRPLYERRVLFFRRYDLSAQVWDLAVIVGGLEIRFPSLITLAREGWTFLRTGRPAHPEAFFEIIDTPQDPNSPYSPYYLGFGSFQDIGFKEIYQDQSNQVRHFMAGVGLSFFYGQLGERVALSRETPGSPDYRLYVEGAFAFAHLLELYAFHTGGPPPDMGDWLRKTLGGTEGGVP